MKRLSILLIASLLLFLLVGCGGNAALRLSSSQAGSLTVVQGDQKTLSVTVTHDAKNQGVNWSLSGTSCTGAACGTLTSSTTTSVVYNTPASVTSTLSVTVTATSITDTSKTLSFSITVMPPPSVTTTTLTNGTVNTAYSATLAASGGVSPYTWSITSGSLPGGLSLSTGGVISGTPTAYGTSTFTVQVSDSSSTAHKAIQSLSLTIDPGALAITTTSVPSGTINSVYAGATLAATGGVSPYTWSIISGSLPGGISLSTGGVLSGTPTASGTFSFTVTATDSASTAHTKSQALSMTINPALSVTTTSLTDGAVNTSYSTILASSGGTSPVTWSVSVGSLPTGLSLSTGGVLSGTPIAIGTSSFTVQAVDSSSPQQAAVQALSLTIDAAPLVISTTSLANATIGTAYSATLASTGGTGTITWSISSGSLPSWASLNASTGVISGTPTGSPTTTSFTVEATDSASTPVTKTQALSITTVAGGVNNAELTGHYAFTASGYNSTGTSLLKLAGALVADGNGTITGGVLDFNSSSAGHYALSITSGHYSIGSDQRGTVTITTSQGDTNLAIAVGGISSGVANVGRILSKDNYVMAGDFKMQDTTAFVTSSFSGNYAFGLSGFGSDGRVALAGVLAMNSAGTLTSPSYDMNYGGTLTTQGTFSGSFSVSDTTYGRGTLVNTTDRSNMAFYVVSASEIMIISTDDYSTGEPVFSGAAQKQVGTFTAANLNGKTSIFMAQSVSSYSNGEPATAYTGVGRFVFGNGTLTGQMDENDGGSITHTTGISGTYSLATTGRMTIVADGSTIPEVFYLYGLGKAYVVGTDGAVSEGELKVQSGSSFTTSSLDGSFVFGIRPPIMKTSRYDIGVVTLDGAGAVSGTQDENDAGTYTSGSKFTDTYTVASDGRVTLSSNIMYLISTTKAVMMSIDSGSTNPTLHMIDTQ